MANLKDIKRSIQSVKNTQQITKAMKMVSAAKLRRAQENIEMARPYAVKMLEMANNLASGTNKDSHPMLSAKTETNQSHLIIISSDRGLCGGFNTNIIKTAEAFIAERGAENVDLTLIGRRVVDHFKRYHGDNVKSKVFFGNKSPEYDFAMEQAAAVINEYVSGNVKEVYVVFSEFKSVMTQTPHLQKLLPFEAEVTGTEEEAGPKANYLYEPGEEEVLASLLPKSVEVSIYRGLLESAASEHAARMTAMDNATRNAKEMIGSLTLTYNRARQAAITTELIEIVSGAESLKG